MSEDDYIVINENNIKDILFSKDVQPSNRYLTNEQNENKAEETWNRKPKKQHKINSYLHPNPYLRHLNMKNAQNIVSLPILKNDSRVTELKACNIKNIGNIVPSNTCAF